MKRIVVILSITLCLFLVVSCNSESSSTIEVVTAEEMKALTELDDVQLVDVRTPEEYSDGYIEGFQNIDFFAPDFESKIEGLDRSKPVIVYCKSGNRSGKCAAMMEEKGFVKIYDLEGGITQWKSKEFDVKMNP